MRAVATCDFASSGHLGQGHMADSGHGADGLST